MTESDLNSIANLHTEHKMRRQSTLEMAEDDYGEESDADSVCLD